MRNVDVWSVLCAALCLALTGGAEAGLVSYWPLDTGFGDAVGTNPGTAEGGAAISNAVYRTGGGSVPTDYKNNWYADVGHVSGEKWFTTTMTATPHGGGAWSRRPTSSGYANAPQLVDPASELHKSFPLKAGSSPTPPAEATTCSAGPGTSTPDTPMATPPSKSGSRWPA